MAEFVGMSVAVIIVTASIVLAGIIIGVGRAFGYKRLENFGVDELSQSVINAAIIGGLASLIALISGVSASLVTDQCGNGDAPAHLSCSLTNLKETLFDLFSHTIKTLDIVGYFQSLTLEFNAFSIAPFENLSSVSNILSMQVFSMQLLILLLELNVQILNFVEQNALLLILPLGLVFRTLFITRRAGGFLIALAIGLYLFYPAFILIFPNPEPVVQNTTAQLMNFTGNSNYATIPIIDLNDNYAIGGKLDLMSGRCLSNSTNSSMCAGLITNSSSTSADFTGDLTVISQSNSDAISRVLFYSVLAPLLSLLVTIVFVKEVGEVLGSEIGLSTFAVV